MSRVDRQIWNVTTHYAMMQYTYSYNIINVKYYILPILYKKYHYCTSEREAYLKKSEKERGDYDGYRNT